MALPIMELINTTVTSPVFSSFTSKCFSWVIDWPSKGKLKKKKLKELNSHLEFLTLYILTSINILHTVALTFGTDKENWFDNQELLKLVIISYILITFTFESRLIL